MEEEGKRLKEENRGLRDQLEEEQFERKKLEKRLEEAMQPREKTPGQ